MELLLEDIRGQVAATHEAINATRRELGARMDDMESRFNDRFVVLEVAVRQN
jgi:hypothetical protein